MKSLLIGLVFLGFSEAAHARQNCSSTTTFSHNVFRVMTCCTSPSTGASYSTVSTWSIIGNLISSGDWQIGCPAFRTGQDSQEIVETPDSFSNMIEERFEKEVLSNEYSR